MKKFNRAYNDVITIENLLCAWKEFIRNKKKKNDVALFQSKLMNNIFQLRDDLKNRTYNHDKYHSFNIFDPKPRNIHKASVRDRLVHRLLYQTLYRYFDKKFIYDSYSCRETKGTHKALYRFATMARKASLNNTRTIWILKCDIKKFFANISHNFLKKILSHYIEDNDLLRLLGNVIDSFNTVKKQEIGLPLGNLTSQLFVNIYMNEFDQFVKRKLKIKYYIRYTDDFVIFHHKKENLTKYIGPVDKFLRDKLGLLLHPDKIDLKTLGSGIDFLGWTQFPYHRVLRTTTKRRMFKRIKEHPNIETIISYKSLLKHGGGYKLSQKIEKSLESNRIQGT